MSTSKKTAFAVYLSVSFLLGLYTFQFVYQWHFTEAGPYFSARPLDPRICRGTLEQLGAALAMYVTDNDQDALPPALDPVIEDYLPKGFALRCPHRTDPDAAHFEYVGAGLKLDGEFASPVVRELPVNHVASYDSSFLEEPVTGPTIFDAYVLRLDGIVDWREETFSLTEEDVSFLEKRFHLRRKTLPLVEKISFVAAYAVLLCAIGIALYRNALPSNTWNVNAAVKGALSGACVAGGVSLFFFMYSFVFLELVREVALSHVMVRYYPLVAFPALILPDRGVLTAYVAAIWVHHIVLGTLLALGLSTVDRLAHRKPERRRRVTPRRPSPPRDS